MLLIGEGTRVFGGHFTLGGAAGVDEDVAGVGVVVGAGR